MVRNQRNHTVLWKRSEKKKLGAQILTANNDKVTSDPRVEVIHETGGEVYVLLIRNVTHRDAGMYMCEVNSDPPLRSFHQLNILAHGLVPPSESLVAPGGAGQSTTAAPASTSSVSPWGYSTVRPVVHEYRDCCLSRNVSAACLGFCSLKAILDGDTGASPADCEPDFPAIAACMADGRDHTPCCSEAGVPPVCQDLCRGEYTVQTDNIKSRFSCAAHTPPTLACIAAGIGMCRLKY